MKMMFAAVLIALPVSHASARPVQCMQSIIGEGPMETVDLIGTKKAIYNGQTYKVTFRNRTTLNPSGIPVFLLKIERADEANFFSCFPGELP